MINSNRFISIFSLAKVADAAEIRRDIRQLISLADHASSVRRLDIVGQVASKLQEFSLPSGVAEFYTALTLPGEIAERMLAKVATSAPDRYKARAITNLGKLRCARGDFAEGVRLYREAPRVTVAGDPFVDIAANRIAAVTSSLQGDHRYALNALESGLPAARVISQNTPALFLDYLNSYAVELAAVGRLEEARRVSEFVVASPAALAYPEWRETLEGIRDRRRETGDRRVTLVPVSGLPSPVNVVHLAPRASFEDAKTAAHSSARVLLFRRLETVANKKREDPAKPAAAANVREKEIDLLKLVLDSNLDEQTIDAITAYINASEKHRHAIGKILSADEAALDRLTKLISR